MFACVNTRTFPKMQPNLDANPFRPTDLTTTSDGSWERGVDFAPILHRWEKFRLWYNGVLITYTLLGSALIAPQLLIDIPFLFQICLLGALCNLCFFTGPALEAYGRYFGMWSSLLSLLLFLLGLAFTGVLASAFLIVRAFQ